MKTRTISQKMAQAAYAKIAKRDPSKEYTSFAREFPTLVHSCGLAQAVAFAQAKQGTHVEYVNDLAGVLNAIGHADVANCEALAAWTRSDGANVTEYLRMSRDALLAAGWLKRYVEAAKDSRDQ